MLAIGVTLVVALHILRTDVDPARHYISEYGNESWSWVLTLALVAIAAGLMCLGSVISSLAHATVAARMLVASGALLVLAAFTSTDRRGGEVIDATLSGKLHGLMAILAFCLLVAAMLAYWHGLGDRRQSYGRAAIWAAPAAVGAVATVALAFAWVPEAHGLRQRTFLAIVFSWLLVTALELRRGVRQMERDDA